MILIQAGTVGLIQGDDHSTNRGGVVQWRAE